MFRPSFLARLWHSAGASITTVVLALAYSAHLVLTLQAPRRRVAVRAVAKDEDVQFSAAMESIGKPAYLRRRPAQGKADV